MRSCTRKFCAKVQRVARGEPRGQVTHRKKEGDWRRGWDRLDSLRARVLHRRRRKPAFSRPITESSCSDCRYPSSWQQRSRRPCTRSSGRPGGVPRRRASRPSAACRSSGATPGASPGRRPSAASASRRRSCGTIAVILTSQAGTGEVRQGPRLVQGGNPAEAGERALAPVGAGAGQVSFLVTALDRATGRRAWEFELPAEGALPFVHEKHNLASPSPVTDGERIYAWFGTGQVAAIDMSGKLVWKKHLGAEYGRVRDQLGTRQLPGGPRRRPAPALLPRASVLPARAGCPHRRAQVEGRCVPGRDVLQHAARRRDGRPAGSHRQLERRHERRTTWRPASASGTSPRPIAFRCRCRSITAA